MTKISQNYRSTSTHLFSVGQYVRIKGQAVTAETDTYRITGTLPPKENSPQYRIQNQIEPHERVITQELIEPAVLSRVSEHETLVEQTFGKLPDVSIRPKNRSTKDFGAQK